MVCAVSRVASRDRIAQFSSCSVTKADEGRKSSLTSCTLISILTDIRRPFVALFEFKAGAVGDVAVAQKCLTLLSKLGCKYKYHITCQ